MSEDVDAYELLRKAAEARDLSHAPYSGIRVGAAILDVQGRVYCGANIENMCFALSMCAERVAASIAVFAGSKVWKAVAVCSDAGPDGCPCGACLQVLAEFASGELLVIWGSDAQHCHSARLMDLLPKPFRVSA